MANRVESALPAPMSSRSTDIVEGRTMSACRAVAVQNGSCTTTVCGLANASRSRARSWWWWNGFPPHQ